MSIITVGIDLAKNIFAVHGIDEFGKAALVKPKVARENLLALVVQLPPCVIGMEACSGAHHWARLFRQHGHTATRADASAREATNGKLSDGANSSIRRRGADSQSKCNRSSEREGS